MRTFKALAANKHQELPTEAMLYLTKQSYQENFKLVFGYDYSFIKNKLWEILKDGKEQRVTFFMFYDKIIKFI
jgi:hypothetical protein